MEFLANENFPFQSIKLLRDAGYLVFSIIETNPGISDDQVIEIAQTKDLIILTFDKDYGEILYKHRVPNPPSVVFFRFKGPSPEIAGNLLLRILESNEIIIKNKFTVIEKDNIRQRDYRN